jgi:2-polyprenyl-3-methyl-5-hydroxy-6-metoxy-1,4-benzoquinol methylase
MHEEPRVGPALDKVHSLINHDRYERWARKARTLKDLIAIPTKFTGLEYLSEATAFESQYKSEQAEVIYRGIRSRIAGPYIVCDVGCGALQFGLPFWRLIKKRHGSRYVGLDVCQDIIDYNAQKLHGLEELDENFVLIQGYAEELAGLEQFNVIINGQNLIHLVEDECLDLAIRQQCEHILPNGIAVIYGPFMDHNQYADYLDIGNDYILKNEDTKIRTEKNILRRFERHHFRKVCDPILSQYFGF